MAHLLSVFVHELGPSRDLEPVSTKTNEIPATPKLLLRLPLRAWVVAEDALLTQEEIAETVLRAGGEYVMPVKGNQPGLQQAWQQVFSQPFLPGWRPETTETYEKGHGRRELRRLTVVAPPAKARLKWGWVRQYFLLERVRWTGKAAAPERTVMYGITSLGRQAAGQGFYCQRANPQPAKHSIDRGPDHAGSHHPGTAGADRHRPVGTAAAPHLQHGTRRGAGKGPARRGSVASTVQVPAPPRRLIRHSLANVAMTRTAELRNPDRGRESTTLLRPATSWHEKAE